MIYRYPNDNQLVDIENTTLLHQRYRRWAGLAQSNTVYMVIQLKEVSFSTSVNHLLIHPLQMTRRE